MAMPKSFQIMSEETPTIYKGFFDLIDAVKKDSGLDDKTFELVYLAIKAASGQDGIPSVITHAARAKAAGATREEVRGAVLVSLVTNGLQGVSSCLVTALETYDNA